MESRKVQRVGLSSLSVSLPITWTKEVGLKAGDMIFFKREKEGSLQLMLNTHLMKKEDEIFIIHSDLCSEPKMLERTIIGNYLIGRDTLRIVSSKRIKSEHLNEARRITRRLIGMSIIEVIPSQILLQCSIDPAKFKIDMLLRRLSIIALTMLKESVQAFTTLDAELAKDVISREDEANALYWLTVRLLNSAQANQTVAEKISLEGLEKIPEYRLISKSIEKIADCAESIAKRASSLAENEKDATVSYGKEPVEKLTSFSDSTCDVFQKSMGCVFSGDIRAANSVLDMKNNLEDEEERLLMIELPRYFSSVILGLARVVENSATIAAVAINGALKKPMDICEPY